LERYSRGIDNAHIDVHLCPRLRKSVRTIVRKLILEDIRGRDRSTVKEPVSAEDMRSFRESYVGVFESASEQTSASLSTDRLALLQISLLKYLIHCVSQESANLQQAFKSTMNKDEKRARGRDIPMRKHFAALTRDEQGVNRRVLRFLIRQASLLENNQLERVRESLVGVAWPIPRRAFFNPILMVRDLDNVKELARVYPIARLAEGGDTDWLFQTNQCVSTVFQYYLPAWTRLPSSSVPSGAGAGAGSGARERRDQGQLPGFLGTEVLLSRFVPAEEYRSGRNSWLDEPQNLRLFMTSVREEADAHSGFAESVFADFRNSELVFAQQSAFGPYAGLGFAKHRIETGLYWRQRGWPDFQRAVVDELHRCLDLQGLGQRIVLLYWLRSVGKRLGRFIPLSLVRDFVEGHLSRRHLAQRLDGLHLALDPASVARVLDDTADRLKRLKPAERARCYRTYLKDFLVFRRDLKLAYKTYEAMDEINLLGDSEQVQLSRANGSLYEFHSGGERPRSERRIGGHAVLKADVRGSTEITEGLRKKGLNPASHFALNFFDPVNKLLPDFGAEKLFVEGDAVIIGLFEHEGEHAAMVVSRACGLAREMLQVVSLQNAINRKHGLPQLELGLGISYSDREPNFLYDEGHRIMISGAMNRADRLSSCTAALRTGCFRPPMEAFRVHVFQSVARSGATQGDGLLRYNVNGIKLERAGFFKLQKEMNLRQVRLSDEQMWDSLFFVGSFRDLTGREHWLVVRYAPVWEWDDRSTGSAVAERGHFFEVVADEALSARVRKLAVGKDSLPLRGRG
jgi:class 3 adenylate cyclase